MSNLKLSRTRKHKFFQFRFRNENLTSIDGVVTAVNGNILSIRSTNGIVTNHKLDQLIYPSLRFYNDNIIPKHRIK